MESANDNERSDHDRNDESDSFDDKWDVSFTSQSANDSIYLPTPQYQFKNSLSRVTASSVL